MNMFEFAIQMEKDAEALYRKMAAGAPVAGIKKVLLMLAEDELRHRLAIEQLQKKQSVTPTEGVALDIKTVFDEMKQDENTVKISVDAVDEYEKALEIEKKGIKFYKDKFAATEDAASAKLFKVLMRQETYHYKTVQTLLDMVQKPQWWVENAEFNPQNSDFY